jgi:hypothetical protein
VDLEVRGILYELTVSFLGLVRESAAMPWVGEGGAQ